MAKTPYARTTVSENRESKMRATAPTILSKAGFNIKQSRKAKGMQLIDAIGPDGAPVTAWVKCGWAPGTHDTCAVQIDFPGPDNRPTDSEGVVRVVTEKAARAAALGATHLFLYAADDDVQNSLAAYLLPIAKTERVTRESIDIAPSLVKNGYSPSLYIYAKKPPKDKLVAVVQAHSIDLLARTRVAPLQREDAINDLDQTPTGSITPAKVITTGLTYERDQSVRRYVLKRAAGKCEYCGATGFLMMNGDHYLEAHHIISLAKQGPDTLDNVIALCADHHRQAHYGANSASLEGEMLQRLILLNMTS